MTSRRPVADRTACYANGAQAYYESPSEKLETGAMANPSLQSFMQRGITQKIKITGRKIIFNF